MPYDQRSQPMSDISHRLIRQMFRSSRLADFATVEELTRQTGHPRERWPLVIVKELIDNGLDICEEHGKAPKIAVEVSVERGEIVVADNGPGMPTEVIDSILDYTVRTSSRAAYVSPTRGQQGNALQTIIAMPFALDRDIGETVIIDACRVAHRITFRADPISQIPQISCVRGRSSVKTGTRVTVRWPQKACPILKGIARRFLPLCWDYVALNPHLALSLTCDNGQMIESKPTDPEWQKWRPSDPITASWYTAARFEHRIAATVQHRRENGLPLPALRDFLAEFRGLSGTAKRAAILQGLDLSRAPLDAFFKDGRVDRAGI